MVEIFKQRIISSSGRVDSVTAAAMDAELAKLLHEDKKLVLDLKNVVYLSSAGVRAIVKALQSTQNREAVSSF